MRGHHHVHGRGIIKLLLILLILAIIAIYVFTPEKITLD